MIRLYKVDFRGLHFPLSKHQVSKHPNSAGEFQGSVVRGGIRFKSDMFILEKLVIEEANLNPNIKFRNQKGEWGHGGVPWLRVYL